MKPIKVYYHYYIDPVVNTSLWYLWLHDHLSEIRDSGLSDLAEVNMCITMPKHYRFINSIPITRNGTQDQIQFHEKVVEYITENYNFVNILEIRDSGEKSLYEGQTLKYLYDDALANDAYYLYIHSKGSFSYSNGRPAMLHWSKFMNKYIIHDWTRCIKTLQTFEVAAIDDLNSRKNDTVSANFWWANSSYIRKLSDPVDTQNINRYSFERWITSGRPFIKYVNTINVDPYLEIV